MKPLFDTVTIIGIGLIGASLALAVKKHKLARHIICADADKKHVAAAKRLKLVDAATTDSREAVKKADLVILAVPVGVCGKVAREIAKHLKPGAIVTDVGSVKSTVMRDVAPHLPAHVDFVPGHPIAGTEHSGPKAGFAELFIDRWCILTPTPGTSKAAIRKVTALWKGVGAKVDCMDVTHHDRVLAMTSHLPHLVAFTAVATAAELEGDAGREVLKYSAGGFRDLTRNAASDPTMWRDIFLANSDLLLEIAGRFEKGMKTLQKSIRDGDGEAIFNSLTRTRAIRRGMIKKA